MANDPGNAPGVGRSLPLAYIENFVGTLGFTPSWLPAYNAHYPRFPDPLPNTGAMPDDPFSEMNIEGLLIPARSFPISSLPEAILTRILRVLLVAEEIRPAQRTPSAPFLAWAAFEEGSLSRKGLFNMGVLRACKMFHRLGQPIFHQENIFHIVVRDQVVSSLSGFLSREVLVLPETQFQVQPRMTNRASMIRKVKFSGVIEQNNFIRKGHGFRSRAASELLTRQLLQILQLFLINFDAARDEIAVRRSGWDSLLRGANELRSLELSLEGFDPEFFWCCPEVEKHYSHMTKEAIGMISTAMQGFFTHGILFSNSVLIKTLVIYEDENAT